MDNEILRRKINGFYNYVRINAVRNKDIVNKTNFGKGNVSNYLNRKVNPSENFIITFEKSYQVKLEEYENSFIDQKLLKLNNTKEDALKALNQIRKKNSSSEGRIITKSELIPVEQYLIPVKGQAGLRKAFFYPDEYIEENFDKEIAFVRPEDRDVYYKIEVDGGSMPGILNPGEWALCVEIPKIQWLEKGTFKKEKVYCLFHRTLGILFKRISNVNQDVITLSSENKDKIEYPDQEFQLMEFSKILIVKRKEVLF